MDFLNDFLSNLVPALMLAALAVLAHLAYERRWAWWLLKVLLWLAWVGALLLSLLFAATGYLMAAHPEKAATVPGFPPETFAWMGGGGLLICLAWLLVLLPWTRRLLFKITPANPASPPHELAAFCFVPCVIGVSIYLLNFYNVQAMLAMLQKTNLVVSVVSFFMLEVLLVFAGSGLFVRRTWAQVQQRLGLQVPAKKQLLLAVGAGFILFGVVFALSELLIRPYISPEFMAFEKAMALKGSLGWILFAGTLSALAAGVGEELIFRGLLQPVFGLLPTSVLFALIHFHYGPSLLMLAILALGLVFGVIRQRYGTVTAMVVHFSFDLAALLLSSLALLQS